MIKTFIIIFALSISACKQEVLVPEHPHKSQGAIITEDNTVVFLSQYLG